MFRPKSSHPPTDDLQSVLPESKRFFERVVEYFSGQES